jgi:hypothetical protein
MGSFLFFINFWNQELRGKPTSYVPMAREENTFKNSRYPDSYRDGEPARRSGGLNPQ